ncbi:MAG: LEVG family PEP-CTERM protein [Scytonema sp. PMC 1069.18]|nr:LEVG family PEP-CTERM protein [Scytonema sp. PMC 1069.18]MEC4884824.1 LEVG family PEP-CTERM protein [Scytonema sp. PMC 1070.18]
MQKFGFVVATILGSLGLGLAAHVPAAHAMSLIPSQEGEIKLTNTNINCVASTCIDTTSFGYTVTSLAYDGSPEAPNYGLSRLFVDNSATANDWGSGIIFKTKDAGTNPNTNEFWFRPVAYLTTPTGSFNPGQLPAVNPVENGQLEIGRFKFEFDKTISELTLEFFDIEDAYKSGVLEINGQAVANLLNAGPDGNRQTLVLKDVQSLVLQLGNPGPDSRFRNTGDGVALSQVVATPEPGTVLSVGALAVAGLFGLRQRKKVSQVG